MRVSASIGLAMAEPGTPFEAVLQQADLAVYGAKERGCGRLESGAGSVEVR